jgi:Ca-activated chloride channel family protein
MRVSWRRALSIVAVLLASALVDARQQGPIRSGTRTVAVYATVTDAEGRLVPDLTRDDFEIYDNGKRQPLSVFASEIQPITVVMLLDRSGSMQTNFRLVEVAAGEFVRRLLPEDKVRIGSFAGRVQLDPRDFTSDRETMLGILATELQPAGPTPLWNAISVGITALLHQERRRVILVFTDGIDAPMRFGANNMNLPDVTRRAVAEDVMIYAIGLAARMPSSGGRRGGMGRRGGFGGGSPGGRVQQPDPGLKKVAAETGGGYFELTSTNDLSGAFARVADELHRQYALGFEPPALDGKTHRLEVRLKRPGMTVRARKSYVAAREW